MSLKSLLLNEFKIVITTNRQRYEKLSVSYRNTVTDERKQKTKEEIRRQAEYVHKLTNIYNRFTTEKIVFDNDYLFHTEPASKSFVETPQILDVSPNEIQLA